LSSTITLDAIVILQLFVVQEKDDILTLHATLKSGFLGGKLNSVRPHKIDF
jgi:hypothetical protein